ncbi:hypothetical protein IH981_01975 [Patescibacteria group bacterium]|nr:hypothetical protein [Patescibacteria group bacterium]
MPNQKFLTIDIGSAWTKVFLVSLGPDDKLSVEKSARLPTSWGDFSISFNSLVSKISEPEATKIVVSNFPEVEKLAKNTNADFVNEEEAAAALVKYFRTRGQNFFILDAGASNLKDNFKAEEIGKYLTFASNPIFLENFIGKKRYKPHILPSDTKELEIEEAFLRSSFRAKLSGRDKKKKSLIAITGGAISGGPRLSRVALILLDILDKYEVAQVQFDRDFFLPSFGALLAKFKQLHAIGYGRWLENLGTFVSLGHSLPIELDWGYSQLQKVEMAEGEIAIVPVPIEQKIHLTFATKTKDKKKFDINGGSLGVVLDSRVKPLQLTFGQGSSRHLMEGWLKQIEKAEITKEAF